MAFGFLGVLLAAGTAASALAAPAVSQLKDIPSGYTQTPMSVSYTHLDVYKRQQQRSYDGFVKRMGALRPHLDAMGIQYHPEPDLGWADSHKGH